MTPQARAIIKQVAEERGVDPALIVKPGRKPGIFRARMEAAKRLTACGYSSTRVGRMLGHDHTTIIFYLGGLKRKPSPERPPKKLKWKPPQIRHVRWIGTPKQFLKPYAGADMTDYHWKERTRHDQSPSS